MTSEMQPDVAVIVPTHNRPEMLAGAVQAIVEQDYGGLIDVIVVYDRADPDETLVSAQPGRTVRVVRNTRSPGLPGARNTGIDACPDADVVAFCDDDDVWLPNKLRTQVDAMRDRPEVWLTTTGITIEFEGERTDRASPTDELTIAWLVRDRTTEAHPSTFVFRRSALDEVGAVDEEIPGGYSEDYDYLLRVARGGRILCIAQPLVVIRWGRTSYFTTRWRTIVDAQRYLLAKHPEFAADRRAQARVRGQIAFALAALGERRESFREMGRVFMVWPFERRLPVTVLVVLKLISPERVLGLAHRFGRGI